MRKVYLLFIFIFGLNVHAQNPDDIVNIPDANFKAKLLQANTSNTIAGLGNISSTYTPSLYVKIDTNNDGEIQYSEASSITFLKLGIDGISSNIINLTGIEAFQNLKVLNCKLNQISVLNVSNLIGLEYLDCSNNNISVLDTNQLTNLKVLYCFYNSNLSSINVSSNLLLKQLSCGNTLITSLDVSQNIDLELLSFNNCQITNIDVTNNVNLKKMFCSNNLLSTLNVSQNILMDRIDCNNNQLTTLDISQNTQLIYLYCYNNLLQNLDISQNTLLRFFRCNNNQLTTLNLENNSDLWDIYCQNNQLTTLDLSNSVNYLNYIDCSNNLLNTLFIKNGRVEQNLNFAGNPTLEFICADESQISSIQAQSGTNTLVTSYCSFTPGGSYNSVTGMVRFDAENNGCNSNYISFPNSVRLNISNGTVSSGTFPTTDGSYLLYTLTGSSILSTSLENPNYFTISPSIATINTTTLGNILTQDFCITPNGIKNDLEITIIPIEVARPGFDAEYKIIYKNKGNQIANGALTFNFDDSVMDFLSSIPSIDGSGTNTLNWNFTNLNPFETREIDLVFNINSPMETPAVNGGDFLVYTATIVGATDETPNDNTFTLNQTVVNSYDPNDKTCLEGNTISPNMVGQYVHYVIRFENTGTFAAENVVIADVIDATKFEISSLVPQSSSHDFFTRINGNKVEFIFENINLPFDDENNDGYVAFKIKTKSNLVVGNTFTNKANIYFDYNFPIITNTTSTTVTALSNQDFDFETNFTLYPNPAKEVLNIKTKTEMDVKSISIYNTLGQIIMTTIHAENGDINVSNLQSGNYFIKVFTDKGSSTVKFIKK